MFGPQHYTTPNRPSFTFTSTAAAAVIPLIALAIVAFPVPTLGFLAGVATALAVRR